MRKFLLMALLLSFSLLGFAQSGKVTGKVTDETGAPVPFASVSQKGTDYGVSADANGNFSIDARNGVVLVISATGFTTKDVTVSGTNLIITLQRLQDIIEEVVVTALGVQRQKRDLGYSTATIKNEVLTQAAPVNAINGLQGKISGVNITSINNGVFEDVKINIRGIRSLTGSNNPLLVLDGVMTPLGYLTSINPQDIENINVLKGSSAAAIYGPDARNGVIIVTTKNGFKNDKTEVNLSHTIQMSNISFFPKFQTEFGSGGYGEYIAYENWSWGPKFDGSMVELGSPLKDGTKQMVPYSANNSRKEFFNTALTNQTDLSIQAKDFFISIQDVKLKGIVPKDENRRTGIRLNSGKEFGKFKTRIGLNYIRGDYNIFDDVAMGDYNAANNVGLNNGLLNLIFNTPAQVPLTKYKNYKDMPFGSYETYFNHYGLNPYLAIDNWRQFGRRDDIIGNFEVQYYPMENLGITWRVANSYRNSSTTRTSLGQDPRPATNVNTVELIPAYLSEGNGRSNRLSSEFFANYTKEIGKFKVNALAGTYVRQTDYKSIGVGNTALVVPELFAVSNKVGEYTGSSSISKSRIFSYYGSLSFNYSNWANIEFTGRRDKTSVLAEGHNAYFYPGVNAAFVLTDVIPGLKNDFLSYLKLRGSWNKTGNAEIDAYSLSPTFSQAGGFPYGILPGFTANNGLTDPLLKPEFIETYEVGAEMSFLKNRITAGLAYYYNNNTDQIIDVSVSPTTGYTSAKVNAASFKNYGWEFDLSLTPLVNLGEVKVNFIANASYNNSKILSIYQGLDRLFVGGYTNASNYAVKGMPAFVFMVTDYLRDSATGKIIVDRGTGLPSANPNNSIFGRTTPTWVLGLTPTISFRNLSLSIVAEYKGGKGYMGYGNIGSAMAWTGVSYATGYNNRERFVIPNSVYKNESGALVPNNNITINSVTDFYTGVYRNAESNFLYSAEHWRIREVALGYEMPKKLFQKSNFIKNGRIAFNARNLFLWVPKSNQYTDPDFNFSVGNSSGISNSAINPPTRTMGVTINLTF
jgi:TonB-linked SusC/RagA family outer membrane protein